MIEYLVRHNHSEYWASITIPPSGPAIVCHNANTFPDDAVREMPNQEARNTIDWLTQRPNEYTITIVE